VQQRADAVVHLHLAQAGEEPGRGVDLQHALAVVLQVVVPRKQIFRERVEVERVALIAAFPEVLELGGKARLPGAVVGINKDVFLVLQLIAEVLRQRGQARERSCTHVSSSDGFGKSCCMRPRLWVRRALSFSLCAAIRSSSELRQAAMRCCSTGSGKRSSIDLTISPERLPWPP